MTKLFFILLLTFSIRTVSGYNLFPRNAAGKTAYTALDTIGEGGKDTKDQVIEEVVKSKSTPATNKAQYVNQLTRFGFKNLFSNNSYNTSLPYNSQINPNAEIFVKDYIKRHGHYLENMKDWGQPYFNLIDGVLQQYGLPKELKYIAVIESNLSSKATSYMGAGGPWQFMPYTAREYGLVVNGYQDDRRDYYRSTHAAARYLLTLYRQLHDWLLVMAAYNGGPGTVNSAIRRSGSKDFWKLQYYLPEESRTYVKRFIATHYIMEGSGGVTTAGNSLHSNVASLANLNIPGKEASPGNSNHPKEDLPGIDEKIISGKYNSLVIANSLVMDIALFNQFNPNFDGVIAHEGSFTLRLPADKMALFMANKYAILSESIQLILNGAAIPQNTMKSQKGK